MISLALSFLHIAKTQRTQVFHFCTGSRELGIYSLEHIKLNLSSSNGMQCSLPAVGVGVFPQRLLKGGSCTFFPGSVP